MYDCEANASDVCQGHHLIASFRASSIPAVAAYAPTRLFSTLTCAQRLQVCTIHRRFKHRTALRCAEKVLRRDEAAGGLQAPSPNSNSMVRIGAERARHLPSRQQPRVLRGLRERGFRFGERYVRADL